MTPIQKPTFAFLLALTAACGGADDGEAVLDVRGEGAVLLAGRQGDDPWQVLTADAHGRVLYPVDRPYELIGVCTRDGVSVEVIAGGPQDVVGELGNSLDIGCPRVPAGAVTLTTTSTETLTVFIAATSRQVSSAQSGVIAVDPGRHDVGVFHPDTRMLAIRRDVELIDGMALAVDLTGALPLVERPLADVPAGARIQSSSRTLGGTYMPLTNSLNGWMVPPALAVPGDDHSMLLREFDESGLRSRFSRVGGLDVNDTTPLVIVLPPQVTDATLTWDLAPSATYDTSAWTIGDDSIFGIPLDTTAQASWFMRSSPNAARTAGHLAAPSGFNDIPGWDPSWNGMDVAYLTGFGLRRDTAAGVEGVNWLVEVFP